MISKNIEFIASFLLGLIVTYFMYHLASDFVHFVDRGIFDLFDAIMGRWFLQHIIFALSIGIIPVVSFIAWSIRKKKNKGTILKYYLLGYFIQCGSIVASFFLLVFYNSSGRSWAIPMVIRQPSLWFWNYVFIGSIFLVLLVLLIISYIKNNAGDRNNQAVIDV